MTWSLLLSLAIAVGVLGSGQRAAAFTVTDFVFETGTQEVPSAWDVNLEIHGSAISSVGVALPGGGELALVDEGGGTFLLEQFFSDRAALISAFPAGDYTFTFNVGLPDSDSVVVSHVDPPTAASGFPANLSPSGPGVPVDTPSISWSCPGCVGDAFRINLFDVGSDDEVLLGFTSAAESSFPIPPGPLQPATSYELDVNLVDFLSSTVISIGDGTTTYQDQFVAETGALFTTVPEPSTAFLLAAGLAWVGARRRVLRR